MLNPHGRHRPIYEQENRMTTTAAPAAELRALLAAVRPADPHGRLEGEVRARLDALTKPQGSMGRLEELALRVARAQGRVRPAADRKAVLIFAGDHGVCEEGVSAYHPEVTAQLCYAYAAGGGVVNALARQAGAEVVVVDVGVAHDFAGAPGIRHRKLARGSRNLARQPALTADEVERAMLAGAEAVAELADVDVLAVGEVGIGNTTVAAALAALLTGAPARALVGRGTGVGDRTLARKAALVDAVVRRSGGILGPLDAVAQAGGFEFAALAGAMLAAAARRVPVVLDGFATGVAALLAVRLCPDAADFLVAAHRSAEQGHATVLAELGLRPLLEWDLRLGEASGAALVFPLVDSACVLLRDVATFAEAGVEPSRDPRGTG